VHRAEQIEVKHTSCTGIRKRGGKFVAGVLCRVLVTKEPASCAQYDAHVTRTPWIPV